MCNLITVSSLPGNASQPWPLSDHSNSGTWELSCQQTKTWPDSFLPRVVGQWSQLPMRWCLISPGETVRSCIRTYPAWSQSSTIARFRPTTPHEFRLSQPLQLCSLTCGCLLTPLSVHLHASCPRRVSSVLSLCGKVSMAPANPATRSMKHLFCTRLWWGCSQDLRELVTGWRDRVK